MSKEIKTGILVLLGITLFIFGFNYLKGENLFEPTNVYHTTFNYNALNKSAIVTVKGNLVGKVSDIGYDFDTGKTKVSFIVNKDLKFSKNTIVRMYETGLMGGNGLALILSKEGEMAQAGDVLKSEVESGLVTNLSKNFSGISSELNTTLKSTDTLVANLNRLIVDDSNTALKSAIRELNKTLVSFGRTSNAVNSLITKNDQKITGLLDRFNLMSQDLAAISSELKAAHIGNSIDSLSHTLTNFNTLLGKVNSGEGTIGKFLHDEALYKNLEGASFQLEQLLEDAKLNPKRYVHFSLFGRKQKEYDAAGNQVKSK